MSDLWDRFGEMCRAINPSAENGGLFQPVAPDELASAEAIMGVAFPQDLRSAYLRFNGSDLKEVRVLPRQFAWIPVDVLSPTGRMYAAWKGMVEFEGEHPDLVEDQAVSDQMADEAGDQVYSKYIDRHRILIASKGTGSGLFIDMKPPQSGTVGQLVFADPEDPDGCKLLASSFGEAIERLVDAYEAGRIRYVVDGDANWVFPDGSEIALEDWSTL